MNIFTYQPLSNTDNIRLLKLSPTSDNQLQCSLHEIYLDGEYNPEEPPPKYTALSYTWGDTTSTAPLLCDGKEMEITASLAEALHMTLRSNPQEFLWVDQICINQKDAEEKAGQVRRMTLVYQRAETILAWIGPERGDTGLAIEWINKVASLTRGFGNDVFRDYGNGDERRKIETPEAISYARSEELGVPFSNGEAWQAFSSFYDRAWFQRIWVVQEILPAREASVVCGTHSVDWHRVKAAAAWYSYKSGLIKSKYDEKRKVDGIRHCCTMNLPWRLRGGSEFMAELMGQTVRPVYRWAYEELLVSFRDRLAGDARDKVFALLGISTLSRLIDHPLFTPDYTKGVMEVYRDATRGFVEAESRYSGSLNVLLNAVPRSEEPGWPTWVPDWRITDVSGVGGPLPSLDLTSIVKNTHQYVEPSPGEENELPVQGHILGRIVHRSEYHHIGGLLSNIRAQRDECRKVYEDRFLSDSIYIYTGESVDTAWAMSLQGGRLQKSFVDKATSPAKFGEILIDMLETLHLPRATAKEEEFRKQQVKPYVDVYGLDPDWLEYTRQKYCERRWFITDKGHIGLGNHHLRNGDVVALLWGLDKACILRPLDGRHGTYEFVGEAYCHGAEEALEGLEKNDQGNFIGVNLVLV